MDTVSQHVNSKLKVAIEEANKARAMGDAPTSPMDLALLNLSIGLADVAFLLAEEIDALRARPQG